MNKKGKKVKGINTELKKFANWLRNRPCTKKSGEGYVLLFNFYLPIKIWGQIGELAEKEGISRSEVIRNILRRYLNEKQTE